MNDVISRRELLRRGGQLGTLAAMPPVVGAALPSLDVPAGTGLRVGPDIYQSIGVRPLINARGTFTILSGSVMLPEVRAAIEAAAKHYVHLDELADAVGARLAELTGAEWGMVASGCAAALTHATAACVAGGNPDLHVRIPDLRGFPKDEVIIPRHSRNVYDAALRAVGVRVVEVSTPAELETAIGPRTALIYVLAGPGADKSELPLTAIAATATPRNVPILVDAAAEVLTIPNVHLQQGATLVGYSGGKCLRGPQTAGLLLGRKDLVRAAWVHSAPHHGFARGKKVGKEEAIGMLMAVEMWKKRDHDAEWARWTSWLEHIARRVGGIDGVTAAITQPEGLSNKTPSLRVLWNREKLGLAGDAVARELFQTEPRIALSPARSRAVPEQTGVPGQTGVPAQTGVTVTPYMMAPGDERVVADRLHAILSKPPSALTAVSPPPAAPVADLTGRWDVHIRFAAGESTHALHLAQREAEITGSHQGDFVSRDLTGAIAGDAIRLRSVLGEQSGDALNYAFAGTVSGNEMAGTLEMGEYLGATWKATRRESRTGGGRS